MNLNIDDWRDGYIEFCEYNNITPGGDDDLIDWMETTNYNYLDDEQYNLNKCLDGDILVIGNIGRWNGRANGYKILNNNLKNILNILDDYIEFYGDGREIRATGCHHDGTNYYLFRQLRPGRNPAALLDDIYNGREISAQKLNYYTKSIYNDVANVYGWSKAMNALQEITKILTAMGANPAPVSSTEIKINAPIINGGNGGTNEKTEN